MLAVCKKMKFRFVENSMAGRFVLSFIRLFKSLWKMKIHIGHALLGLKKETYEMKKRMF